MKENQQTENALEIVADEDTKSLVERENQVASLQVHSEDQPLVAKERIKEYYEQAIECIQQDREEASERYLQFADMAVNGGDPSSATKEAMVSLLKVKSDGVNQMVKILDLWTRLAMKDKATSSQIYAYQQNNKYEVAGSGPNSHVRKLIKIAQEMESKSDNE